MLLAADRPNYLPSIEYFHKMQHAGVFVLADDIQYTSPGFINRALIKSAGGKQWLTVPVLTRGKNRQIIKDVKIAADRHWWQKHRKTLQVNYQYAPYWEFYVDFFESVFQKEWVFLLDLNLEIIEFIRATLGIATPLRLASDLNITSRGVERIIDIVKKMDCRQYFAGQHDRSFLQTFLFEAAGVELFFHDFQSPVYRQQFENFLPNLSIIDLLFNFGPEAKQVLKKLPN
jgi:hypothetical protein